MLGTRKIMTRDRLVGCLIAVVALWPRVGVAQGRDTARAAQPPGPGRAPAAQVDSTAISSIPMMWMHLDSVAGWSPAQMQRMMTAHRQMAAQMLQYMGPGHMMGPGMMGPGMGMGPGSPWTALRDSVQRDLAELPGLSGTGLSTRMSAHIDRMRRMMVLGMGMMNGGGWAAMPGGCGMFSTVGHMSPAHAQWMWAMHGRMWPEMLAAMTANLRSRGIEPGPQWFALRDSVQADMGVLPRLTGDGLRARMLAHADRMHRLMGMQVQAMGMHMGPMGMGCPW